MMNLFRLLGTLLVLLVYIGSGISPTLAIAPGGFCRNANTGGYCYDSAPSGCLAAPPYSTTGRRLTCDPGLICKYDPRLTSPGRIFYTCQVADSISSVFGQIEPPESIARLGFAAMGISKLLNIIITLIYMAAAIIFIFMILISAFQWIVSGGDKEQIGNAQKRITHAIIGIVLLAVSWVFIRVLGLVTGFTFF